MLGCYSFIIIITEVNSVFSIKKKKKKVNFRLSKYCSSEIKKTMENRSRMKKHSQIRCFTCAYLSSFSDLTFSK